MNRWKELMNSHFRGCTLLYQGYDANRNRPAKFYAIPGDFSVVGYSDDTDTFMVPTSSTYTYLPKAVTEALAAIQRGEDFHYVPPEPARKRITVNIPALQSPAAAPVTTRKRIHAQIQR